MDHTAAAPTRRQLLAWIGSLAGASASYRAMAELGFAPASPYRQPVRLAGSARAASVIVLGAGIAGLTAALELRDQGYDVKILEYNSRVGGRNWTLRGGDTYTELGGFQQQCGFDEGHYLNPGPWRIPYHHTGLLHYCRRLGVRLEPFVELSHNALLHSRTAFGGKPQRYSAVRASFDGAVAELLAKAANQHALDATVHGEELDMLLEALRHWGALEKDLTFTGGAHAAAHSVPPPAAPLGRDDLLRSELWRYIAGASSFQTTMFQPVGGMDNISKAFEREIGHLIRYNSRVTEVHQDTNSVTVSYVDARSGGEPQRISAQWCVCTLPLTVLSQTEMTVTPALRASINAISYAAAVKVGLQFKRRFWEEDDRIFGGISYTDLPIRQIGYPNYNLAQPGKGVLLGAYIFGGAGAFEFTALDPAERVRRAVEFGAQIHPQYRAEFESGIAVAWHRVPWLLGCSAHWTEELRKQHFETLRAIDGRIVLAGDHISDLTAWQEGAVVSAHDAITRLHERVISAPAAVSS